jgi:hypothetical protein
LRIRAGNSTALIGVSSGSSGVGLIIFGAPSFPLRQSPRRISAAAEESHPLNSVALLATILNDVVAFSVGGDFLNFHSLCAHNAAQETYQWALIVVHMRHQPAHFRFALC